MFQSRILSRFSRLALLSVFCVGLFITSGELSLSTNEVEITNRGIESVMAANCGGTGQPECPKETTDTTINTIISILNLGIGILTFLITPLIMLAGWLLSPDWTFGEIFGLRPILHQLWILISNVVYVIFGFMLVFIAFANIFGGEHSKAYEMKTMLPKLVTGMLIVPFTWFIVSAVLSVSNVLTASVIQLPVSTILKAGGETSGFLKDPIIPKTIIYSKGAGFGTESSTGANGFTNNKEFTASNCSGGSADCLTIEEFLTNGKGGAYNLLSVYAYGIFRIQEYKEISVEEGINKILDIASKLGFGIIFFVIFGILVIAIIYALFSRALMLWLYAMFSPVFALTFVLGDKAKKLEKFTIKEFISLAMVPVYVSAALAFGLMFLGLVMGATNSGGDGKITSDVVTITPEGDSTTTFKFGEITLTTVGLLTPKLKSGTGKALDIGKGVIGTIIVNVLALAILWMAVMAALGASKITEAAVQPIKGFGDEIGKLAMKAPQYVPIPLPSKDGKDRSLTMAGVGAMGGSISSAISSAATKGGMEFGQTFGNSMASAMGLEVNKTAGILKALENDAINHNKTPDTKAQYIARNFETGKLDAGGYAKDTISRHQLATNFEKVGIDTKLVEELKKANDEPKIGEVLHKIDKELNGRLFKDKKGADSSTSIIEQMKEYSGTATTTPRYTIDTGKKIHINIDGKKSEEITYIIDEQKNLKVGKSSLEEVLKSKGLENPEIKEIIDHIKDNPHL
ncbi:MAG: hypothetical protein PHN60_00685 [Candidatus Gracilibacteria bacterium]|nr:hypothetical protein [Candidatus Gracilibacteria bacterium]